MKCVRVGPWEYDLLHDKWMSRWVDHVSPLVWNISVMPLCNSGSLSLHLNPCCCFFIFHEVSSTFSSDVTHSCCRRFTTVGKFLPPFCHNLQSRGNAFVIPRKHCLCCHLQIWVWSCLYETAIQEKPPEWDALGKLNSLFTCEAQLTKRRNYSPSYSFVSSHFFIL